MLRISRSALGLALALAAPLPALEAVQTDKGKVAGSLSADKKTRIFLGIPYAAPPLGPLRWKPPQEAAPWKGVLKADAFGRRPMQTKIWDDMNFRDPGVSEDCLSLNVWAPLGAAKAPVMVWIHGGGFAAGGSSEPRQDGEALSKKGVVVLSMNYRLGIFGFFSHPGLSKEAGGASGNYGLLDQAAALSWVKKNIAAFGGDPDNVTVFGESAGSFSVSAHMASPLSQGLFHKAIGQSGAFFGDTLAAKDHKEAEADGENFAAGLGAASLKDLRAMSAEALQAAVAKELFRFNASLDGAFLPAPVSELYALSRQAKVPLLAGWNRDEGGPEAVFGSETPSAEAYARRAQLLFGEHAGAFLKLYPGKTTQEAVRSASDFGGDKFIAHSTWKWLEAHAATGLSPIYRYRFDQPAPGQDRAYHSLEIEFVFGTLPSKALAWAEEDFALSGLMMDYWTNFARTGDPNAAGLPPWPSTNARTGYAVMHLQPKASARPDEQRERHLFLQEHPPLKLP